MPGGNGTGPAGMGPMTGRAAGYCAGYSVPGFANPIGGRGFWGGGGGFGRGGGGRGWRNQYYATGIPGWQRFGAGYPAYGGAASYAGAAPYGAPYGGAYDPATTKQQELDTLKGQAEYFKDALDGIKKRITELEAESVK
ncbi:MAG: DUF5320 domain-containing protein [Sedimentisphaerales bacterium]|nr:DUF5320 domain-containing protein [Sedimentisphaerales bacterium]